VSEGSSELLDELDLRILRALSEDARRSCREVAEKLQVASGTVYNRIKRMMDKGVIEGYIPLVDPAKLGYDLTTLILAQVDHKQLLEIEERLVKLEYVNAIYDITGEFDIAVIARVKDRETLNDLVKKILHIPGVNRTVTNVVFDVVKEDFRVKI
jgi:DNA-binding Lrp family transcriptional regulator